MTDSELSTGIALQGQLEDVLVDVPGLTLAGLSRATQFDVFDWCDAVKDAVAARRSIPNPPKCLRRYLRPEQLAGEWTAFTTWRPSEPKKLQRGLFA